MKRFLFIFVALICTGCSRYVEVGDVECTIHVKFENNIPVFVTTYSITLGNNSIDRVITGYASTITIIDNHKKVLQSIPVSVERMMPRQLHQVTIVHNYTEEAIQPLLDEMEMDINEVIKQQEASFIFPESMIEDAGVTYKTVDIVTYLKEVGK